MLETIASSSFTFWVVALVIIVIDSVVLLAPGEFAFVFDRRGRPAVRAPAAPYLVRNKDLSFALRFFARPFFVSSVNAPDASAAQLLELRRLAQRHRSINAYSAVTMGLLVVVGPALTVFVGISQALLMVLPVLYANAIVAVIDVAATRQSFDMPLRSFLFLAFEFIVCPALVANLNKRLIDRSVVPNTFQLIGDDQALQARIRSNLEFLDLAVPRVRLDEHG
jgi:hypothetical protein